MTEKHYSPPEWLNLERPDLGTVEFLRLELCKAKTPEVCDELRALIEQTETRAESRRRESMRKK